MTRALRPVSCENRGMNSELVVGADVRPQTGCGAVACGRLAGDDGLKLAGDD
jgi:hypothetical protein